MTDSDRGQLFVEQENIQKEIQRLKKALESNGQLWSIFGEKLQRSPDRIVFSNAPDNLGNTGPELMSEPAFNWGDFGDLTQIARTIQDYRAAQRKLRDVQSRLAQRY